MTTAAWPTKRARPSSTRVVTPPQEYRTVAANEELVDFGADAASASYGLCRCCEQQSAPSGEQAIFDKSTLGLGYTSPFLAATSLFHFRSRTTITSRPAFASDRTASYLPRYRPPIEGRRHRVSRLVHDFESAASQSRIAVGIPPSARRSHSGVVATHNDDSRAISSLQLDTWTIDA